MCHISPEHVGMLTGFTWLALGAGVLSVLSGHTYYRRMIARRDEPLQFWIASLSVLTLGAWMLYNLKTCPVY